MFGMPLQSHPFTLSIVYFVTATLVSKYVRLLSGLCSFPILFYLFFPSLVPSHLLGVSWNVTKAFDQCKGNFLQLVSIMLSCLFPLGIYYNSKVFFFLFFCLNYEWSSSLPLEYNLPCGRNIRCSVHIFRIKIIADYY